MEFALIGYRFCRTVAKTDESRDVIRQLRRAFSGVAANYRASRRSQSDRALAAKLAIVIEEADECGFWLDFLVRLELVNPPSAGELAGESNELVAIFTKAKKSVEARIQRAKPAGARTRATNPQRASQASP